MRSISFALVVVLGVCMAASTSGIAQIPAAPTQSVAEGPLVFDSVTVIDVQRGQHLPAQRVVIVGNHIQAIGPANAVQLPANARVVNARGKYLIPGLWDMHTHSQYATETFYPLFLANGVTGIRDAGSPIPLDTLRLWRQDILAGRRVGPPRQILSGPAVDDVNPQCERARIHDNVTCVRDSSDARHVVDSLHAAGADMLKIREVPPAMYFVLANEARRIHMPFGGHAFGEESYDVELGPNLTTVRGKTNPKANPLEASDSGAQIIDHVLGDDHFPQEGVCSMQAAMSGHAAGRGSVAQCQADAKHFARNGTWLVPTEIVMNQDGRYGKGPWAERTMRLNECAKQFWAGSLPAGNWLHAVISRLSQAALHPSAADSVSTMHIAAQTNLPILAGTDVESRAKRGFVRSFAGFSLHMELAMNVVDGLTPLQALQSTTLNPAKMLHATDSLGTVAAGKLADLVLLDADPLVDITNTTAIRAVVANGRYFDRTALDHILADVRTSVEPVKR